MEKIGAPGGQAFPVAVGAAELGATRSASSAAARAADSSASWVAFSFEPPPWCPNPAEPASSAASRAADSPTSWVGSSFERGVVAAPAVGAEDAGVLGGVVVEVSALASWVMPTIAPAAAPVTRPAASAHAATRFFDMASPFAIESCNRVGAPWPLRVRATWEQPERRTPPASDLATDHRDDTSQTAHRVAGTAASARVLAARATDSQLTHRQFLPGSRQAGRMWRSSVQGGGYPAAPGSPPVGGRP